MIFAVFDVLLAVNTQRIRSRLVEAPSFTNSGARGGLKIHRIHEYSCLLTDKQTNATKT